MLALVWSAAGCGPCSGDVATGAELRFRTGEREWALPISGLRERIDPVKVTIQDPNYGEKKRYEGLPLRDVVSEAFGGEPEKLRTRRFVFQAADGYAVHAEGERVMEEGGLLVYRDLDEPGWEPIGPQRVSPGPFYLVWTGEGQHDQKKYPWPYALVLVEGIDLREAYGRTYPDHVSDPVASRGHEVFLRDCIRCHAVNRQGGRLGPDLNVPQNVTEYRDVEYLRQFITDPEAFRYGSMPAMHLPDGELTAVIHYLSVMRDRKHHGS